MSAILLSSCCHFDQLLRLCNWPSTWQPPETGKYGSKNQLNTAATSVSGKHSNSGFSVSAVACLYCLPLSSHCCGKFGELPATAAQRRTTLNPICAQIHKYTCIAQIQIHFKHKYTFRNTNKLQPKPNASVSQTLKMVSTFAVQLTITNTTKSTNTQIFTIYN